MQTENMFLKLLSKAIVGSHEAIGIIKSELKMHHTFYNEKKANKLNLKKNEASER